MKKIELFLLMKKMEEYSWQLQLQWLLHIFGHLIIILPSVDLGTIEVPSSYYVTATTLGPTDTTCVSMTALTGRWANNDDCSLLFFEGTIVSSSAGQTATATGIATLFRYPFLDLVLSFLYSHHKLPFSFHFISSLVIFSIIICLPSPLSLHLIQWLLILFSVPCFAFTQDRIFFLFPLVGYPDWMLSLSH